MTTGVLSVKKSPSTSTALTAQKEMLGVLMAQR